MTPEEYQRLQRDFEVMVGVPADQREERLRELCPGDAARLAALRSLLEASDAAGAFLEAPATARLVDDDEGPLPEPAGRRIGHYTIVRPLAAGGMGIVYVATQAHPSRQVALKVVSNLALSRAALKRFRLEAEILGRLDHPGIARIYEAGAETGEHGSIPFFAMELVEAALPITRFAEHHHLDRRQRIGLFLQLCDAVHFGHQRGVIHRDLKPANVLVDRSGRVKVIDFGVARVTDAEATMVTQRTEAGQVVGTLQYMSPEQAEGDLRAIDVRSDVYALGVILFELLCGRRPYDLGGLPMHAAVRAVREETPARPSSVDTSLRGDLDTIVLKAIEKDPVRRYQSAAEIATDLRRHIDHVPISARPPSAAYQLAKFARRNRTLVGGVIASFLLLVAGIVGTSIGLVRARMAASDADAARANAEFESYVANIVAADAALANGDAAVARERLAATSPDLRDWEWHYLNERTDRSLWKAKANATEVRAVAWSEDGSRLVAAGWEPVIRIYDGADGRLLHEVAAHGREVNDLAILPGRDGFVTVSHDRTLARWSFRDPDDPLVRVPARADLEHTMVAMNDGSVLVTGEGGVNRVDPETLATLTRRSVPQAVEGSINGLGWLAVEPAMPAEQARVLVGMTSAVCVLAGPDLEVRRTIALPDGQLSGVGWLAATGEILTVSSAGVIRILDPDSGVERRSRVADEPLRSMDIASDGRTIALGTRRGSVLLVDVETLATKARLLGHGGQVLAVRWSPDGRRLASGATDGQVRIWSAGTQDIVTIAAFREWVYCLAFDPDSTALAAGSSELLPADPPVAVWNTSDWTRRWSAPADPHGIVFALTFVDGGATVAYQDEEPGIALCSATDGAPVGIVPGAEPYLPLREIPERNEIRVTALKQPWIAGIDRSTGQERWRVTSSLKELTDLSIGQDGRLAAFSAKGSGEVEIIDLERREIVTRIGFGSVQINFIAFAADGATAAACSADGSVTLFTIGDGVPLGTLASSGLPIKHALFASGDRRLFVVYFDGTVRLWDVPRREEILVLRGPSTLYSKAVLSSDGRRLAVGYLDGQIRVYEALGAVGP